MFACVFSSCYLKTQHYEKFEFHKKEKIGLGTVMYNVKCSNRVKFFVTENRFFPNVSPCGFVRGKKAFFPLTKPQGETLGKNDLQCKMILKRFLGDRKSIRHRKTHSLKQLGIALERFFVLLFRKVQDK